MRPKASFTGKLLSLNFPDIVQMGCRPMRKSECPIHLAWTLTCPLVQNLCKVQFNLCVDRTDYHLENSNWWVGMLMFWCCHWTQTQNAATLVGSECTECRFSACLQIAFPSILWCLKWQARVGRACPSTDWARPGEIWNIILLWKVIWKELTLLGLSKVQPR